MRITTICARGRFSYPFADAQSPFALILDLAQSGSINKSINAFHHMPTTSLPSTTLNVDPGWIDEYGHMNAAQYVGVFDKVGFGLLAQVGLGQDYTQATNCGIYTMNIHVAYLREVLLGDPLRLQIRLLQADDKRVLTLMELWQTRDNYLAATMEQLSLHVDLGVRRSRPFDPALAQRLAGVVAEHSTVALPAGYRRVLPLGRV